ncbi:hypothetical protein BW730_16535 [Tessaracoccus aquimaris]|uniref:Uncharacterized protein n=1 Tax=Tessaracoccus aquimaris TaxID=1332264 RepID=A0A1Q2CRW8_9ACTN|nr:hypothetical protein BW730_16535 [Tessaracoccus aquimaris]
MPGLDGALLLGGGLGGLGRLVDRGEQRRVAQGVGVGRVVQVEAALGLLLGSEFRLGRPLGLHDRLLLDRRVHWLLRLDVGLGRLLCLSLRCLRGLHIGDLGGVSNEGCRLDGGWRDPLPGADPEHRHLGEHAQLLVTGEPDEGLGVGGQVDGGDGGGPHHHGQLEDLVVVDGLQVDAQVTLPAEARLVPGDGAVAFQRDLAAVGVDHADPATGEAVQAVAVPEERAEVGHRVEPDLACQLQQPVDRLRRHDVGPEVVDQLGGPRGAGSMTTSIVGPASTSQLPGVYVTLQAAMGSVIWSSSEWALWARLRGARLVS